jgi:hypothetical protein
MPTWDEGKRRLNLRLHRLDFVGAEAIWDGPTVTREDVRKDYGEKRLVTFGLLDAEVVVLVHVERDDDMHIISSTLNKPAQAMPPDLSTRIGAAISPMTASIRATTAASA